MNAMIEYVMNMNLLNLATERKVGLRTFEQSHTIHDMSRCEVWNVQGSPPVNMCMDLKHLNCREYDLNSISRSSKIILTRRSGFGHNYESVML
jgi:hypothetical protein